MKPFQQTLLSALMSSLLCPIALAEGTAQHTHLDNITVTANKMEENVNEVPQAITVVDAYELEEKGIKNVPDLIKEIPNMSSGNNGGYTVNFRGLNTSIFTNNNPVVIYIDGVPTSSRYGYDASLANVERVEVLRGPQGTLYGKDAIGAIINIVTKEPDNEWHGQVGVEAGTQNSLFGTFNTSGALIKDTLYMGINGQGSRDDGWIENTYPGMEKNANRENDSKLGAYLLYKPTERLKAKLNVAHEEGHKYWWDGYSLAGSVDIDDFNRDDAEKVSYDVEQLEKTTLDSQSLNIGYEFDTVAFESTTTHKTFVLDGDYDSDFGDNPAYAGLKQLNGQDTTTWTQELRFSSQNTTGLRWVGGFYFDTETREQKPYGQQFPSYDPNTLAFLGNYELNAESTTDSATQAAFGQLMIPFSEKWDLTLGARAQRIEKEIDLDMYYLPVGASGAPMYQLSDKKSWDSLLPKAALSYQFDPAWTVYTSYAKGYMPGGYNYFATQGSSDDNSFEPQTSDDYEIGVKGSYQSWTLSANLFYMDIRDIHVYKSSGTLYLTENAKRAHSQGAELELSWFATDDLYLGAAVGIADAKYDDYDNGTTTFDGQNIENTPSHTVRFSLAYEPELAWYGRLDVENKGDIYYYNDAKQEMQKSSGYTVADLKAGYRLKDWNLYGYIKNLTDEAYLQSFMSSSSLSVATFGSPRTFGLGARYAF